MRRFCRLAADTNCFTTFPFCANETPSHGLRQFGNCKGCMLLSLRYFPIPKLWKRLAFPMLYPMVARN